MKRYRILQCHRGEMDKLEEEMEAATLEGYEVSSIAMSGEDRTTYGRVVVVMELPRDEWQRRGGGIPGFPRFQ